MSNYASTGSKWLKDYSAKVDKKRNKSNGNKWLVPLIFTIIMGGLVGVMVANGGLNDPQKLGAIKILGVIAGVMLLLTIILIATGKKKVASNRTSVNLDALLTSAEEVAAFDQQMAASPVFKVENSANNCIFATKDYLGYKFSDMGDETYTFIHLRDISSFHYQAGKMVGPERPYIFDLRDASGKVLLNGVLENHSKLIGLEEGIQVALNNIQFIEEKED